MAIKINRDVNIWSIATMVVLTTASFTWLQADVKALQTKDVQIETRISETRAEITRVETIFTRRIDIADQRAERDREAILTIQGDIRVVRQILEGMRASPPGPR